MEYFTSHAHSNHKVSPTADVRAPALENESYCVDCRLKAGCPCAPERVRSNKLLLVSRPSSDWRVCVCVRVGRARAARAQWAVHSLSARARARTHEDRGAPRRAPGARAPPGEAALLLHRPHRHGHPPLAQQEAHPERDLRVPAAAVPLLPQLVPGLEELRPPQPQPERVLREAAQGARAAGQGPLLDDPPLVGVHVRGGLVPAAATRLQAEVPGAEAAARGGLLRGTRGGRRRAGARLRGGRGRVRHVRVRRAAAAAVRRRVLRLRRRARLGAVRGAIPSAAVAAPRPARHNPQLPVPRRQRPRFIVNVRERARRPRPDAAGWVAELGGSRGVHGPPAGPPPGPQAPHPPAGAAARLYRADALDVRRPLLRPPHMKCFSLTLRRRFCQRSCCIYKHGDVSCERTIIITFVLKVPSCNLSCNSRSTECQQIIIISTCCKKANCNY